MAGTIVVDRIESDASYTSTINVANRITFSNTVNFGVFAGTAPVAGFYLPTTNNLAFTTASTERMRIDSSGNVGIGTASPSFASGTGLAIYNASVPRLKLTNSTTGDDSTDGTQLLVSGSDFYIQQREAASVIISTNGSDRVTIDSAGTLKTFSTISVGAATPSTSGAGITFPATQSASSNANTLDDYEEGTWTPAMTQTGATFTYSYQIGRYTKVGNVVTILATLGWSAKSGGSGSVGFSGLPFSSLNVTATYQMISCGEFSGFTLPAGTTVLDAEILTNLTTGTFYGSGSAVSPAAITTIASSGLLFLQCAYLSN